jgi:hypothetical protein
LSSIARVVCRHEGGWFCLSYLSWRQAIAGIYSLGVKKIHHKLGASKRVTVRNIELVTQVAQLRLAFATLKPGFASCSEL